MSIKLNTIVTSVRGMIIDRVRDGIVPLFSTDDIINAINSTKNDFFSIRPEAFNITTIATAPPADLILENLLEPSSIIVTGTGTDADTTYTQVSEENGKGEWSPDANIPHVSGAGIFWDIDGGLNEYWIMLVGGGSDAWRSNDDTEHPARTGWGLSDSGFPAPIVNYVFDYDPNFAGILFEISPWALQQFCYGVASYLLSQRGKDKFYRKAADAMRELYIGG